MTSICPIQGSPIQTASESAQTKACTEKDKKTADSRIATISISKARFGNAQDLLILGPWDTSGKFTGYSKIVSLQHKFVFEGDFLDGEIRSGKAYFLAAKVAKADSANNFFRHEDYVTYEGFWEKNQFNGLGKLKIPNKMTLDGLFEDGVFQGGECKKLLKGERLYVGEVQLHNNRYQLQGKGIIFDQQFAKITDGCWREVNDKPFADLEFSNGDYYNGEVNDEGEHHGTGTLRNKDMQVIYEGDWKNGLRDGSGYGTDEFGAYEGSWLNGKRDGKGTSHSKTEIYEGNWKEGKRHGTGTLKDLFGKVLYQGEWKNGLRDGNGTQTKDGSYVAKGQFVNDEYHGKVECTYANGDHFVGIYEHGILKSILGQGTILFDQTSQYKGELAVVNGKVVPQGNGCLYEIQQNKELKLAYEGGWKNGYQHGWGRLYDKSGNALYAEYEEGFLNLKNAVLQLSNDESFHGEMEEFDGSFRLHGTGKWDTKTRRVEGSWDHGKLSKIVSDTDYSTK